MGDAQCTITIIGTPCGTCTIGVSSTQDAFARSIEVNVTVASSQVNINSWQEVD